MLEMDNTELSEFEESQNESGADQDSNDSTKDAVVVEEEDELRNSLDIAATVDFTARSQAKQCHWEKTVARNIKQYLINGEYPSDLPTSESVKKRNFRKRSKDFVVQNDTLYYVDKKTGHLRLAIYSKEERVFQVSYFTETIGHI